MIPPHWRFSSVVTLALCLPLQKASYAIAARPRMSSRKRFFTCIRNQCFLTNQREVRRIGLLKSRFTEHWTGSRTWRAEASTLVQTLVLSAILYWGRRIWTVRSVPSSTSHWETVATTSIVVWNGSERARLYRGFGERNNARRPPGLGKPREIQGTQCSGGLRHPHPAGAVRVEFAFGPLRGMPRGRSPMPHSGDTGNSCDCCRLHRTARAGKLGREGDLEEIACTCANGAATRSRECTDCRTALCSTPNNH